MVLLLWWCLCWGKVVEQDREGISPDLLCDEKISKKRTGRPHGYEHCIDYIFR